MNKLVFKFLESYDETHCRIADDDQPLFTVSLADDTHSTCNLIGFKKLNENTYSDDYKVRYAGLWECPSRNLYFVIPLESVLSYEGGYSYPASFYDPGDGYNIYTDGLIQVEEDFDDIIVFDNKEIALIYFKNLVYGRGLASNSNAIDDEDFESEVFATEFPAIGLTKGGSDQENDFLTVTFGTPDDPTPYTSEPDIDDGPGAWRSYRSFRQGRGHLDY